MNQLFHRAAKASIIAFLFTASSIASAQSYYGRTALNPKNVQSPPTPPSDATYVAGSWSNWSSTCSATAIRTRVVQCIDDGAIVADTKCAGQARPASSEISEVNFGCGYSWKIGELSNHSSTCSPHSIATRSVVCAGTDGVPVDDNICNGPKPDTAVVNPRYDGCTHTYNLSEWGDWSSTCSYRATRTRTVTCVREELGTTVGLEWCGWDQPIVTENAPQYGGCTWDWQIGEWSKWSSTCSDTAARTRSVTCKRSDGQTAADSSCDASATRPASFDVQGVYETCGYRWDSEDWSPYSEQCSLEATRSGPAICRRSDGTVVADSYCPGLSPGTVTETGSNYEGCGALYLFSQATISANQICQGNSQINVSAVYQCYNRDGKGRVSDSSCTSAGAGTKPSSKALTLPCTEYPSTRYNPATASTTSVIPTDLPYWIEIDGVASNADASRMAHEYCNANFSFTALSNSCYMGAYYNPTTNKTLVGIGQRNGVNRSVDGLQRQFTLTLPLNNSRIIVDNTELIHGGGSDVRLTNCGGLYAGKSPGNWSINYNVSCYR